MFYEILRHAHSGLRYVVILLIVGSIFIGFTKWKAKAQNWPDNHHLLFKTNMLLIHVQVLIGLIMYFLSPKVQFNEMTMKDSITRFFTVEHALMMLIVVILVTIAWSKTKRLESTVSRYKTQFIYNLIALIVILAMIPWPFRNLGSSWF